MDLGIAEGAKAKVHRQIRDREFVRTGTHVVGDHETPIPETSIGNCATWTCGVVPSANGTDDIIGSHLSRFSSRLVFPLAGTWYSSCVHLVHLSIKASGVGVS